MNSKIITDTHSAIDRLVAHLERQATEHVHALDALDALRAEVEALRTQNAHLRALQAAGEAKAESLRTQNENLRRFIDGRGPDTAEHVILIANMREENARLQNKLEALQAAQGPKPVREVVRGTYHGSPAMCEPGKDPTKDEGRSALSFGRLGWSAYLDDEAMVGATGLTETEAIAWVLDGVLPKR